MAMRMPRFLRASEHQTLESFESVPPRLRAVGEAAEILRFPVPPAADRTTDPGIPARAELRTRRFTGFTGPEEERYEASFATSGSSSLELLQTLTAMLENVGDFQQRSGAEEPLVIDIRLVAG